MVSLPLPDVVEIDERLRSDDPQRVEPFRRQVQMAGRIERSRRDEEHLLGFDERANPVVDELVNFAHGRPRIPCYRLTLHGDDRQHRWGEHERRGRAFEAVPPCEIVSRTRRASRYPRSTSVGRYKA